MPTMTAAQRRAADKADYDVFMAECPSRQLLDRLSDKWVTLVLCALEDGPQRYSQLARTIAGVSQKMLTQTLRSLERDGMVTRSVTATVPVTVTYELTDARPLAAGRLRRAQGLGRVAHGRTCWRPGPPMMPSHDVLPGSARSPRSLSWGPRARGRLRRLGRQGRR